jgi:hypothetical protein
MVPKKEVDMKSETLHNIRTMRQVKNSLEVAAKQKIRTTNSLSKTAESIEYLESIGTDSTPTLQVLARERARAARFEASVERSQRKLLRSRVKIAGIVNRNRALTRLRHEIQRERDGRKDPPSLIGISVKPENPNFSNLHEIELKY